MLPMVFPCGPSRGSRETEISPSTAREWLESTRLPPIARRVASGHALSPDELPDLLQEIRIALWQAGMEHPINATWVFRTASHKAIDLRREKLTHPDNLELTEDLARESLDQELVNLLRARAAGLSQSLREFYELRYEEGLSQRVIGKRMGLCRSSIRLLERRCLAAMGAPG
jgi:RNA polymerase sigma factor (sigma-70 family)